MSLKMWPKPFYYFNNVRLFLISLCVILSLFIIIVAYFLYARADQLLFQRAQEQALAYADLIEHTKMWNYDYGGVYVVKNEGVQSNSYLLKLGINPDVRLADGRTLTLRNHAIMTKEISVRSEHSGPSFRIVSAQPLDPRNAPDSSETAALGEFGRGRQEFFHLLYNAENPEFRYVIPLRAETSCLECHTTTAGNILGALSITLPVSELVRQTQFSQLLIVLVTLVILGLVVGSSYFLTWRLVIDLDVAQRRLKRLASTDALTGLSNRRHMMKRLDEECERGLRLGEPLCIIMLDLDFFKKINDTWGHPFGDQVLKWTAKCMNDVVRSYDIVGRIGGEEFLIISPGTTLADAVILAERLRATIAQQPMEHGGKKISLTISAGVAVMTDDVNTGEDLINQADAALYRAKQSGRNRVMV